ncbi:MAG: glycosyltransferase family 4 protein [Pseudomonadota bacterium]|nr:glycosyltransferase family 4 protein [Pseudomonadota bacterium]
MPNSILIDVSRLIWRQWTNRLPTGIDRVCRAYLQHFASRAQAVVQFRRLQLILDSADSARLFNLLLDNPNHYRTRLAQILGAAALRPARRVDNKLYLNVGHTGLNSAFLGPWLARRGLKPVILIHDLIPITHPEYCREGEADRHWQRMTNALEAASAMIVNSRATESDLRAFARSRGLPMPPCLVAWLGTDMPPATAVTSAALSERPYFVMVGTIEARKNHLLILEVWAELVGRLGAKAPELVIIGQRGWEADAAIAILDNLGPLSCHVRELGRCDDESMERLIAGAQAMLMPSFVEGFGLPLVESLQKGVPVIASDVAVFREIAGNIPTCLDPTDRQKWVKAILDYSTDGSERRRQLKALQAFHAPTWKSHFALVDEFLETVY